jgi:hypothetical protein
VSANSYDGIYSTTVNLALPKGTDGIEKTMGISFGDVNFNLGCGDGGATDPDVGEIAGHPALFDWIGDRQYRTNQVIWPATKDTLDSAMYSVYGQLSREEIERIANSMTAQS